MGTRGGGLNAFDGIRFQTFTVKDGLKDNNILSLAETPDGIIYIGSNSGLTKYSGKKFEVIPLVKSGNLAVEALYFSSKNGLIIGTNKGLFRYQNQKCEPWLSNFAELSSEITTIHEDQKGRLWFAVPGGVVRYASNKIELFSKKNGLPGTNIRAISSDLENRIWVGFYGEGIALISGDSILPLDIYPQNSDKIIHSLFRDKEGKIWIGTQSDGLGSWNPLDQSFSFYTERDGLANNHVRSVIADHSGNVWIGTSGGGVCRFSGQDFIHYNQKSGLTGRNVYAVAEDSSGAIWFSTSAGGIGLLQGNRVIDYSRREGFPEAKVKKLFVDVTDDLWIGTEGDGLYHVSDGNIERFGLDNGLRGNWIRDIVQDPAGNIWIAKAGGGITCMVENARDSYTFEHFDASKGLPDDRINQLLFHAGRLWYASASKGIGYIESGMVYALPQLLQGNAQKVRSLAPGHGEDIWIGTVESGIFNIKSSGNTWMAKAYTMKDGLSSDNIYLLQKDSKGQLWVGSEKGLDRIRFQNQNNFEIRHFSANEGFVGVETSQNASINDSKGRLWFGTINGLTCCNPSGGKKNNSAPILRLTDVSIAYQPIETSKYAAALDAWNFPLKPLELPYNKNQLSFEFIGINLNNPDQVRYQWILEGVEGQWSPASYRNNVTYSSLPPGEYTFKVKACNEDGIWSESLNWKIVILSPFWLQPWFIMGVIVILIFLIWLYTRTRIRRIKRKSSEAQQKLKVESDLLRLEQKALQLQMNPHFIFNALNSIQSLIGSADERNARQQLARFSKLMRLILESSREEWISLQQEIYILENYLNLENFIHGNKFSFSIQIIGDYQPEEVLIPGMMVQPFVENAIVHGVSSIQNGIINIGFDIQEDHLTAVVSDNGLGREKAMEIRQKLSPQHKSTALKVVEERLALFEALGKLTINDLRNQQGDACGTEVRITLPVKHVF